MGFVEGGNVQNLPYENELDLHENKPVGGTHFHINGFARRLVSKQSQKSTRKWPIKGLFISFVISKWLLP